MDAEQYDEKDFSLWTLIIQTRDVLARVREDELNKYGITLVETRALYLLNELGDQGTPAEMSRHLFREHNTTIALLNRMQKKGLITKNRDPENRNIWRITTTKRGKEAYKNSLIRESIHDIFSILSEDELDKMIACLVKLCDQAFAYIPDVWVPPYPVN
jgi:DNA-binding MarR family transcriptional regulator